MNSASHNFPHHLGVLRERMLHPTDYEYAVNYFIEEFAGDMAFVRASEPEQMPPAGRPAGPPMELMPRLNLMHFGERRGMNQEDGNAGTVFEIALV
jgi:hypothetical protein